MRILPIQWKTTMYSVYVYIHAYLEYWNIDQEKISTYSRSIYTLAAFHAIDNQYMHIYSHVQIEYKKIDQE